MQKKRHRPENPADPVAIRAKALDMLARREHSSLELRDKLLERGWDPDRVEEIIGTLRAEGLQSDERFIEAFVRSRIERGQGPVRIAAELKQRGIENTDAALGAAGVDWRRQAEIALHRRFGPDEPAGWADRAKRMRFLQQRGFTGAQAHAAMEGFDEYE